jgi:hypothetical protein
MGDRRACHPGNRRGAPRGRRPAILADIATALPQDKSSVPDAQRRAQTRLLSLVHGFTPWVYAGLFRPPGEDAADPVSPLGIAEILPALPLSFPLPSSAERVPPKRVSPKGCLRKGVLGRLARIRARQTNKNPPAEEARGVLSQSVARIKGGARGAVRPGRRLGLEASRSVGFGAADAIKPRRAMALKGIRRAGARPAPAGRSEAAAHR